MAKDRLAVNHETQYLELHISKEKLATTSVARIISWLQKTPFSAITIDEAELEKQLLQANSADEPTGVITIGQVEPANLTIEISQDKLKAIAQMEPAKGGKGLTREAVLQQVAKMGIKHGIILKAVDYLAQLSDGKRSNKPVRCTIAQHTPAKPGQPARLEQLSPTLKDRVLKPKKTSDGKVDHKDFGAIVSVTVGQELVRRHPPVEGIPGTNVVGGEIKTSKVKDTKLKADQGSEISSDDENLLLASIEGVPVLTEFGMKVVDVLKLDKIDTKSGHVEYSGSIVVKGDISEGMRVQADGDVLIMGTAEACNISATGDITIENGVFGHRNSEGELSCVLDSEASIVVNRAQNVQLNAKKNIHVATQALHCDINCAQDLTIGLEEKPKGDLIGGSVTVGGSLFCGSIGTDGGAVTQIDLGTTYRAQLDNLNAAKGKWDDEQQALQDLLQEIAHIKAQQDTPELRRQLEMCQSFYKEEEKEAMIVREELKMAQEQLVAALKTIDVIVTQNLYQKVNFSLSDDIVIETMRKYGPSKVSFSGKGLKIDPHQG